MKALIIAENAGRIWRVLEETYTITSTQMMRRLNLDDAAVFAAIGWLAREKKIYCCENRGDWYISNKQPLGFFSFG
ncbi:winged helix-turn-helix domain-containing protein [Coprobacter tertius]|uniref:Winged helix-turn-helix domain-containing protein n=1 Tax=Coprobacter tertius TaxID=2944915 RepID=A0ABT1MHW2_9BACT|nr:winged helix-turn-helix domain-containing protein [Coprobacter tertius]MCP9612227.1 winged helix-turn-helix domain-containing protein [Coprobacter tertius]